ncbi:MAG TPA: hypothetical protein VD860_09620 [Azospirillum sp.]|nr:hypothetical protein [Azospirillum sp.]
MAIPLDTILSDMPEDERAAVDARTADLLAEIHAWRGGGFPSPGEEPSGSPGSAI